MDRALKTERGFTLVELMIVIAVVGILLSIAVSSYRRLARITSINYDLHAIVSFLQSKRLEAFTRKAPIAIPAAASTKSIVANGTTLTLENSFVVPVITINERGLFSTVGTIRLLSTSDGSVNNCITVSLTRVRMGTLNAGGTCDAK